ncbi:MAG: roadblock/LC7 domain-containing protein [Acidobacteriota bacterium]|nr:roadblock/LC7 domain-containing protein [Acidobacteriota bacterium]
MSGSDLILLEEEHVRLSELAETLLTQANASFVGLIDRNGQPLGWCGELPDVDRTALASLAAGNVAATEGLAEMIGEPSFAAMYHEGESEHLHMSTLGRIAILVVAFNERSSLGLVRLRVRQLAPDFEEVFDVMESRSRNPGGSGALGLPEITDEDIDSLFGDSF